MQDKYPLRNKFKFKRLP